MSYQSQSAYPTGWPQMQAGGGTAMAMPTYTGAPVGSPMGAFSGQPGALAPSSVPRWASQYSTGNPMYVQYFAVGDFSRAGFLDEAGLQAALAAAGETTFDPETLEMMIMMFDTDGNHKIDYNEFITLMDYINSMKGQYAAVASSNGMGVIGTRDAAMLMNNNHGEFINNIGGVDTMERGILPTVNPTSQGFFSIGNFIKIAIIIALLRTLYERNKLPFINNPAAGQAAASSNMSSYGAQPQAQQQYGSQGYVPQQYGSQGYNTQQQQQYAYGPSAQQPGKKSGGLLGRIMSTFGGKN